MVSGRWWTAQLGWEQRLHIGLYHTDYGTSVWSRLGAHSPICKWQEEAGECGNIKMFEQGNTETFLKLKTDKIRQSEVLWSFSNIVVTTILLYWNVCMYVCKFRYVSRHRRYLPTYLHSAPRRRGPGIHPTHLLSQSHTVAIQSPNKRSHRRSHTIRHIITHGVTTPGQLQVTNRAGSSCRGVEYLRGI